MGKNKGFVKLSVERCGNPKFDLALNGEKALCLSGRLAATHLPFSLAGGPMRRLRAVVRPMILDVIHRRHQRNSLRAAPQLGSLSVVMRRGEKVLAALDEAP